MAIFEELKDKLFKAIRERNEPLAEETAKHLVEIGRTSGKAATAWVINVTRNRYHCSTNYRSFIFVEPCAAGEPFHATRIESAIDQMDIGDNRRIGVEIFGEDIAKDVVRMVNSDIGEGESFAGVFFSYSEEPPAKDVAEAKDKWLAINKKWVVEGRALYAQGRRVEIIPAYCRRAVQELGLEEEWAYDPKQMMDCPAGCGEKVSPSAAVCKGCKAIINEEKAKKFYPERFAEPQSGAEAPKQRRTRRKKVENAGTDGLGVQPGV